MTSVGLFFLSLFFVSTVAQAQDIEVTATVDRNAMSVGDTFTYVVSVSSDSSVNLETPRMPDLNGFELLNSWSSTQSQSTFVNGSFEVRQTRSFNYMLAPNRAGNLKIGSAQVVVEGKVYNTKPISMTVTNDPSNPIARRGQQQMPDPMDQMEDMEDMFNQLLQRRNLGQGGQRGGQPQQPINPDEAFFIQVEVDKNEAFVGEQITASWYLYTRGQIRDIDTLKYPSVNGFWKEDIELATQLNFTQEIVNGLVYKKALLASYALFPLKAGKAVVDSYKAKCTVITPSNFGFGRPYQFTKSSKPINVTVKDVPKENRPANYSGAVGNFQVRTEIEQKSTPVNQPLTVKLRFEGEGNAKLIDLPPMNLPPELELYDTQADSKFFRDGKSYKEFQLLVIPRQVGEFTVPPVSVSAFNPKTGQFYNQSTQEIKITATPGDGQQNIASTPMAKSMRPGGGSVAPVLPGVQLAWDEASIAGPQKMTVIWGALYTMILLTLTVKAGRELGWLEGRRDLLKLLKPRISKLNTLADKEDWREVGAQGTNLIYFVLGEVSGLGGASHELEKMLLKSPPSVRRELGAEIKEMLVYFETLSFAPEQAVAKIKDKKTLKAKVKDVEKILVKAVSLAEKRDESASVKA